VQKHDAKLGKKMGTERKFKAWGVNSFMKSTPVQRYIRFPEWYYDANLLRLFLQFARIEEFTTASKIVLAVQDKEIEPSYLFQVSVIQLMT
jgi:hypothetical protein